MFRPNRNAQPCTKHAPHPEKPISDSGAAEHVHYPQRPTRGLTDGPTIQNLTQTDTLELHPKAPHLCQVRAHMQPKCAQMKNVVSRKALSTCRFRALQVSVMCPHKVRIQVKSRLSLQPLSSSLAPKTLQGSRQGNMSEGLKVSLLNSFRLSLISSQTCGWGGWFWCCMCMGEGNVDLRSISSCAARVGQSRAVLNSRSNNDIVWISCCSLCLPFSSNEIAWFEYRLGHSVRAYPA